MDHMITPNCREMIPSYAVLHASSICSIVLSIVALNLNVKCAISFIEKIKCAIDREELRRQGSIRSILVDVTDGRHY